MYDKDPTAHLNQTITVQGVARDAHAGAVVLLSDGTPIFIGGLQSWEPALEWKTVRATGTLRDGKMAPDPEVNAKGEVSHGMYGDALVLEHAKWETAQ